MMGVGGLSGTEWGLALAKDTYVGKWSGIRFFFCFLRGLFFSSFF